MWGVAVLLAKFQNEVQGSEMFMTAKRSISTGLVASALVSGATISATLLTSTAWAYSYGVSGAYYYGGGACIQIFIFTVVAVEFKRRAPGAHTFLEISKIRYGTAGHLVQIGYSTLFQIILCVSILVGGASVFTALAGMNELAAIWLLPVGVSMPVLEASVISKLQ